MLNVFCSSLVHRTLSYYPNSHFSDDKIDHQKVRSPCSGLGPLPEALEEKVALISMGGME